MTVSHTELINTLCGKEEDRKPYCCRWNLTAEARMVIERIHSF